MKANKEDKCFTTWKCILQERNSTTSPCQQFVLSPMPRKHFIAWIFLMQTQTSHRTSFKFCYSSSISSTLFLSHREKEKKMLEQICLLKCCSREGKQHKLYCFWWQEDRTTDNVGGRRKYKYLPVKQMQLNFSGGLISIGRTKILLWVPCYLFRQIKGLFQLASNTVGSHFRSQTILVNKFWK